MGPCHILGLACMHNGFKLLSRDPFLPIVAYEQHESLAYGLDFMMHPDESKMRLASCSFYDCLLKVWDFKHDLR